MSKKKDVRRVRKQMKGKVPKHKNKDDKKGNNRVKPNNRDPSVGNVKANVNRTQFNRKEQFTEEKPKPNQKRNNPKTKSKWKNKKYSKADEESSDFEEVEDEPQVTGPSRMDSDEDSDGSSNDESERKDVRQLVTQQNRKNKKSGGFQSMGLSPSVFKGILRKGYKVPTPIQRKTISVIMDGKDIVAMARTGSGKTAAFLIPMFEKLQNHSAVSGARAMILAPTRELALQTLKFAKELGKFTGLRAAVVLGGDRMEDQFAALHENPDIIIATPGRFMHVVVEMNLKLKSVEYVVFDEADRLFEMGFQEQLQEILNRLPETRQTLLFSATLPKLLVDFAKAGLHDPTLVRLDVDTKLSEQLKLTYLQCRHDVKLSALLYLLKNTIPSSEQSVVFAATKHHVEYLNMVLQQAGVSCAVIYSALDPTFRKINLAKFQNRKVMVLLVTDVAARGIDIPLLDNVINYHFPAKPKLFVHRVGRVARAGRKGTAYSLVSPDEIAYVLDLHIFLGYSPKFASVGKPSKDESGLIGKVPQSLIDDAAETIRLWHVRNFDITSMVKVCENAFGHYVRSRPMAAAESIRRVKEMEKMGVQVGVHPILKGDVIDDGEGERQKILNSLKSYKANTTIFEVNSTAKTSAFHVMKKQRKQNEAIIEKKQRSVEIFAHNSEQLESTAEASGEVLGDVDIQDVFSTVIGSKRRMEGQDGVDQKKRKKVQESVRDEENYVAYRPADYQTEQGLRLGSSFDQDVSGAMLDLTGDDNQAIRRGKGLMKWDRKKKKYVRENTEDPKKKKILTESGAWIPASYKSHAYKEWVEKTRRDLAVTNADDNDGDEEKEESKRAMKPRTSANRLTVLGGGEAWRRHRKGGPEEAAGGKKNKFKNKRFEIKRPEQILKERKKKAQKEAFKIRGEKSRKKAAGKKKS